MSCTRVRAGKVWLVIRSSSWRYLMKNAVLFRIIYVLSCFTFTAAAEIPLAGKELFTKMDADSGGLVSLEEYIQFGRAHQERAGKVFNETVARETFAKKDANKDGYLSFVEFSAKNKPNAKYKSAEEQRKEVAARKKAEAIAKAKADEEEEKKREAKREENRRNRSVHGGGGGDDGDDGGKDDGDE